MKKDITKMLNVKLDQVLNLLANIKKLELPFEVDKVLATPEIQNADGFEWALRHYRGTLDDSTTDEQIKLLVEALREIIKLTQQAVCHNGRMLTHSSNRLYRSGYRIEGISERNGDRYIALYFQLPAGRIYFFYDVEIVEDMVNCVNWGFDEPDEVEPNDDLASDTEVVGLVDIPKCWEGLDTGVVPVLFSSDSNTLTDKIIRARVGLGTETIMISPKGVRPTPGHNWECAEQPSNNVVYIKPEPKSLHQGLDILPFPKPRELTTFIYRAKRCIKEFFNKE